MKPLHKHLLINLLTAGVMFGLLYAAMDNREDGVYDFWYF